MIKTLWAEDGRHLMGTQDIRGHSALEERVTASHVRSVRDGGRYFRPATHIQSLPGVVKFRWDMARQATDEVVSVGIGLLELNAEQQILRDLLFTET